MKEKELRDPVLLGVPIIEDGTAHIEPYIPAYAHGFEDAGCDLKADIPGDLTLWPGESAWVGTGVRIAMPEGVFALQTPRSGLSCNHGITLANSPGIIDPGYRGEIRCKMLNLGTRAYTIYPASESPSWCSYRWPTPSSRQRAACRTALAETADTVRPGRCRSNRCLR